jgi:hypothetical protein
MDFGIIGTNIRVEDLAAALGLVCEADSEESLADSPSSLAGPFSFAPRFEVV